MKELLLSALLALQMFTFATVPPASTFFLHVEGLEKVEILSFGKSDNSFVMNVKEGEDELEGWKGKKDAQLRIVEPTGGVTVFCMKGASVKNIAQPTNIVVIYDTLNSFKEE